jgi:hypothetical protein
LGAFSLPDPKHRQPLTLAKVKLRQHADVSS